MANREKMRRIALLRREVTRLSVEGQSYDMRRSHRFMGIVMIFVILLFMIPTYHLAISYLHLQSQKATIQRLEKEKNSLSKQTKAEEKLASQLNDISFVEKYARAKYYYSKSGESIYPAPSLLP